MSSQRLIDTTPAKRRAREIEVLVFGFSRTGTMSLKVALEKLGYKPYHMSEAGQRVWDGHLTFWNEALVAKYEGKGKPFGKEEFDKFLGDYDVLEDIPCILFVDELLAAYPSAKVILTNRDVDTWEVSMKNTFFTITEWKTLPFMMKWDKIFWAPYIKILRTIMSIWGSGDPYNFTALRQYYIQHYAHVREIVPKDRLLEFESKEGWAPLCDFLGKDAPSEPYPRINDAKATVNLHSFVYWLRVTQMLAKPVLVLGAVGAVGFAWWYNVKRV